MPDAGLLAQAILRVGETAQTEEDLRIGMEEVLAPLRRHLSITAHYERTYPASISLLGGGSSDAVYGHAVIEYKRPGLLSRKRDLERAVEELERYLQGEAAREKGDRERALRRIIGIGLDGQSIFFLRYRGDRTRQDAPEPLLPRVQPPLFPLEEPTGSFQRLGPYPITEETIGQFLIYLRALRRPPLTPEALADEFGPKGGVARKMVATLYGRLLDALKPNNPYPKASTFFAEWDRIFGIVYGQDIAKARQDSSELAKLYGLTGTEELKPLLFAVHTYYALLMKLLAAELASLQSGSLVSSLVADLPALSGRELRDKFTELEDGGLFARLGIHNFLEADFFGWYLSAWDQDLEESLRDMARALSDYEPATGSLQPETTRDLLKKLYQYLIPRELRHDLGEYYTPDWLAELVLNEVGYDGNLDRRLLDPACGSGTFLVLAIRRAREYAEEKLFDRRETLQKVLANIVGFDLNPLAVIAARTNYLLALGDLVRYGPVEIPVYLCDSILTPAQKEQSRPLVHQRDLRAPSVVGDFWIPEEVVDRRQVAPLSLILEDCVRGGYSVQEFLERCRRQLALQESGSADSLAALYEKVVSLEREGKNGIWARILKNAFAPLFVGRFDYVAGNPPWVNWESLADAYREATKELWQGYGLFSLKGHAARLGGGKKDVAMLMLYAASDRFLRDGGKLGFVITQTVFKTKGAGDGFRRFRLGEGASLKVRSVHDLVDLQPFEGAGNRTATVVLQKGDPTEYPVDYTLWQKTKPGRIAMGLSLKEVEERTQRTVLSAQPVSSQEITSPWLTSSQSALAALQKAVGPSEYRAYAGSYTGGLNGVYWLRILERRPDGLLLVENLHDVGKTKVKRVEVLLEPDLVYPLLRGRDVDRWRAQSSAHILMVQDPVKRTGYEESWLKVNYPHTYAYLKEFEDVLRSERRSHVVRDLMDKGAFYSMYAVAEYTFAPYKVVWRYIAEDFTCAVVGSHEYQQMTANSVVSDHRLMIVPLQKAVEAYYLCGLLNSSIGRYLVKSYVVGTQISTHVLEHIAVPKFDHANPLHQSLAAVSQRAHQHAALGKVAEAALRQVEEEIDRLAAQLWGLTEEELVEVQRSLKELG